MQFKNIITVLSILTTAIAVPAPSADTATTTNKNLTPFDRAMLLSRAIVPGMENHDLSKRGPCMDDCTDGCGRWVVPPGPGVIPDLAYWGW